MDLKKAKLITEFWKDVKVGIFSYEHKDHKKACELCGMAPESIDKIAEAYAVIAREEQNRWWQAYVRALQAKIKKLKKEVRSLKKQTTFIH